MSAWRVSSSGGRQAAAVVDVLLAGGDGGVAEIGPDMAGPS